MRARARSRARVRRDRQRVRRARSPRTMRRRGRRRDRARRLRAHAGRARTRAGEHSPSHDGNVDEPYLSASSAAAAIAIPSSAGRWGKPPREGRSAGHHQRQPAHGRSGRESHDPSKRRSARPASRAPPRSKARHGHRGYAVELDRARAIHAAILAAGAGDVVLVAGKGHEDYQIIGHREAPARRSTRGAARARGTARPRRWRLTWRRRSRKNRITRTSAGRRACDGRHAGSWRCGACSHGHHDG